jgi:uncharacterized membrane protein (UPF0127 family)
MPVEKGARGRQYLAMRFWKLGWLVAGLSLLGGGCKGDGADKAAAPATNAPPAASTNAEPPAATQAQPKLRTMKIWIGPEELVTEIAASPKEMMTGMMHRTSMEENEAMLFLLPYPQRASFWMKNTLVPLSCAYIDPEGVIVEEHDMKPLDETPIPAGSDRIQYVLEVKQGWFERHKIKPGTLLRTERGSLSQTFSRRQ